MLQFLLQKLEETGKKNKTKRTPNKRKSTTVLNEDKKSLVRIFNSPINNKSNSYCVELLLKNNYYLIGFRRKKKQTVRNSVTLSLFL